MNVKNIFRVKLESTSGDLVCGTFCDLVQNLSMSSVFSYKLNLYISGQCFNFLIPVSCKCMFLSLSVLGYFPFNTLFFVEKQ